VSATLALDDAGYVLTGQDAAGAGSRGENVGLGPPHSLETSLAGVFAVGDARSGSPQRVTAAIGDGAIVIRQVRQRLSGSYVSSARPLARSQRGPIGTWIRLMSEEDCP
jgi:thioredoxin reductase (NADPH)